MSFFYKALLIFPHSPVITSFAPTWLSWSSKAPPKVKAFAWLVANKKVTTNNLLQLRRPNKALSPDNRVMCLKSSELADHLFFHCPAALVLLA